MFMHVQRLINEIVPDEPDPAAANALQEGLGGQFGEMRTMMQYLFQAFNFRGAAGKPYKDLLYGVGTEEISWWRYACPPTRPRSPRLPSSSATVIASAGSPRP